MRQGNFALRLPASFPAATSCARITPLRRAETAKRRATPANLGPMADGEKPPRVFISFARDNSDHIEAVRQFREVLRANGIDARWDGQAGPQVWSSWMTEGIETGDYILVIASPKYKLHAERKGPLEEGRGVRWEARLIEDKLFNEDDEHFLDQVLPVVLPGRSVGELPNWLTPRMRTNFVVRDLTVEGVDRILRHVFKQPYDPPTRVGPRPVLSTRQQEQAAVNGGLPPAQDIAAEFTRALSTFEGRQAALAEIAGWLREADDRSSRFVMSGPGSGKTALLGLIAHLGGGYEYRVGVPLPEACLPPKNSVNVALYVRNMVPGAILTRLAQAAGMSTGEIASEISAQPLADGITSLIGYLRAQHKRMTVLLDALDEESMPKEGDAEASSKDLEELAQILLKPLVTDPDAPIRFLLGGREQVVPLAGFGSAAQDDRVIDLDGAYRDVAALRQWVRTVLRGQDPPRQDAPDYSSPWRDAHRTLVDSAVAEIVGIAGSSFYIGEAIARAQARLRELPDPRSAQWKDALPKDVGPAMRAELQARLAASQAQRAIDLLLPLAYGRGDGIPWAEVWLPLANELRPRSAGPYGDADLEWIRKHASSYVVENSSAYPDRPLFQLYHQSLGAYLRADERHPEGKPDQAADEHTIVRTLLGRVHALADGSRDWARASAYVRDHLLEHAVASGCLADIDELVLDPGFLANGRDAELRAVLGNLTEPHHRAIAAAYSSALAALPASPGEATANPEADGRSPDDVRALLAQLSLAARCRDVDVLARRIRLGTGPGQAPWQAIWAAWRQQPPHVRLSGYTDRVRAVATATLVDDRVVAVTAGDDGGIRIWDVLRGVLVRDIPRAHNGGVLELATGRLGDGTPIVVSVGDDHAVRVWDLNAGNAPTTVFTEHESPVHGVAVAELHHGSTVVVTGDDHGTIRVWDPQTGKEIRPCYARYKTPVTAIALMRLGATTYVVSARVNGDVLVWSLVPRNPRVSTYHWGARAVRALAVGELDRRPMVASAGDDGAIHVWDPASDPTSQDAGRAPLAVHRDGVWALAVAEVNGRPVIVSAGADQTARVWDVDDGAPIGAPFTGHTGAIRALAVTEAGNRTIVISGGDDEVPRVWDVTAAGAANEAFSGHQRKIRSLLFTQIDGRNRLISGGTDATIRRWDPDSGAMMGRPLTGHHQYVGALAVTDLDGRACILSGGADTIVRIWNAASGGEEREPFKIADRPAAVTALLAITVGAEMRIVSAYLNGTVVVWNPGTGQETARYQGHQDTVRALREIRLDPSKPDPLIVSAGADGALHVWEPASGKRVLAERSGHRAVTALADVPSHPSWVASGGDDGMVRVHDLVTGAGSQEWCNQASAVQALAVTSSQDSVMIASAHADGTVQFAEGTVQFSGPSHPRQVTSYPRVHLGGAHALAVGTAAGRSAIFSGGGDAVIRAWDLERKAPLRTMHRGWVRSLAVTVPPEGEPDVDEHPEDEPAADKLMVVSGSDDDTIQIRDLEWDQTQEERVLAAHHRGVRALAVSATERPVVVSGGVDHRLKVWDLSNGKLLGRLGGHGDWVRAVAVSTLRGIGPVAVSAGGDGDVAAWDLSEMTAIGAPRSLHSGGVRAVGIAEVVGDDGQSRAAIVSGGTDKTIVVSLLQTGERIGAPFTGHGSEVRALVATSLGRTQVVISGDDAGTVLAWDLANRGSVGEVPHGPGEVNAIAAQPRGYPGYRGIDCTWVAVAAGETVTLSSWTAERNWEERATARFGCEVLGVAMPQEFWGEEPPGRLVVGATQGLVLLKIADPT
jgi:WD40 repeat protein